MSSQRKPPRPRPIDILLVEDDPGDVLLIEKALVRGKIVDSLTVATDGVEALLLLRKQGPYAGAQRPDLILLDLNMPRMSGREVLLEIKDDLGLRSIPLVILTTSDTDQDVLQSCDLPTSCYLTKPVELEQYTNVAHAIRDFWLSVTQYQWELEGAGM